MNLKDLKKEIPYRYRDQYAKNKTTGVSYVIGQLAYIDARDVMDLLDEVCGQDGWQTDYKMLGNKMYCGIGIFTEEKQWVWKWDMGDETEFESGKGEASDAFKRAAVKWGIGRFLYDLKPTRSPTANAPITSQDAPQRVIDAGVKVVSVPRNSFFVAECEQCGANVTQKVLDYSKDKYAGKIFCMNCQKKEDAKNSIPSM